MPAHGKKRNRTITTEIIVVVERPAVPIYDVLETVYRILATSKTA
jgi:hypothetical protein